MRTAADADRCLIRGLQNRLGSSTDVHPSSHSSANVRPRDGMTANDSQVAARVIEAAIEGRLAAGLSPQTVF